MVRSLAGAAHGGWSWCLGRPYAALLLAIALAVAVPFCTRGQSDWESVYVRAGSRLAAGGDVFRDAYLYPPAFAALAVPFSWLPTVPGRLAWYAVNLLAVAVLVRGAWRLVGGPAFADSSAWPWREHAAFLVAVPAFAPYICDAFSNQQTDLLIGALCIGGCLALTVGRSLGAGLLFGVAAGLKCTPLLWGPYLAWRGQWRAAGLVFAVALAVNLAPDAVWTPPTGQPRLVEWAGKYLSPMSRADYAPGVWGSLIHFNHSLSGVANRFLTGTPDWSDGRLTTVARPDAPSAGVLKAVVAGTALTLVALAVLAAGWRRSAGSPVGEWALVLLLMVVLSPMSSKPHFAVLALPSLWLGRRAWAGDRAAGVCLGLAGVAGMLACKDLVGGWVYDRAMWGGAVLWGTLALGAGCCLGLRPSQTR